MNERAQTVSLSIRNYAIVTAAYWAFTLTDGALRMLVLLHFNQLGYTPVQLAFLFLLYEFFGIVTNLVGGWLAARTGLRVTMVADTNHTNMALVDPLPAGLEAVNPVLATSPRPPAEKPSDTKLATSPGWCCWTWFDHENLRDDRAEAYSAYLYGGSFKYSYVARATTIGDFVVPPAKAEEIYAPEVFGRSASDRVVIG